VPRPIITLTTDFCEGSPYVAQMKAAILSGNAEAAIVDLTHSIPPQDIRQGAVVLDDVTRRFPPHSIHVAVVDPGVGGERAIVFARFGRQDYVAPDNGLLSRLARRQPPDLIIELTDRTFWRPEVSSTFHGRDIMAPVAAHLSLGLAPHRLGSPRKDLVRLDWPEPRVESRRIAGAVESIDSFGNLISNIPAERLSEASADHELTVVCSEREIRGIVAAYAQRPFSSLVALIGSSGRLEVAVVGGHAARTLNARIGDAITVSW
jgi:S-adenosylmethionine hydrolase